MDHHPVWYGCSRVLPNSLIPCVSLENSYSHYCYFTQEEGRLKEVAFFCWNCWVFLSVYLDHVISPRVLVYFLAFITFGPWTPFVSFLHTFEDRVSFFMFIPSALCFLGGSQSSWLVADLWVLLWWEYIFLNEFSITSEDLVCGMCIWFRHHLESEVCFFILKFPNLILISLCESDGSCPIIATSISSPGIMKHLDNVGISQGFWVHSLKSIYY